ncbi:unnamed protein product [Ectocarpus sp. CCAP 1310/34]|nr:unnamed protein product [Ectocarpus sp. CCAP 1310/34]
MSRQTALRNTGEVDNNNGHIGCRLYHLNTFRALLMLITNTKHTRKPAYTIQTERYALPTMHQVYHSLLL